MKFFPTPIKRLVTTSSVTQALIPTTVQVQAEQEVRSVRVLILTISSQAFSADSAADAPTMQTLLCVAVILKLRFTFHLKRRQKGRKQTINYSCVTTCDACHGTGAQPGTSPKTCSSCGGSGRVTINQRTPFGVVQTQRTCDACHGRGKIVDNPCKKCGGSGKQRKNKTVDVTIPAGIKDQQILNVSGRGNSGTNGGPAGDLHVYVNVRPHPVFERRGDDVWCEVPITFTQAALGADVVVPTLDGKVSYTVREGTQPGDVFRLKGKGIQRLGGRGRGDQYVRVTVEVPKNLNGKQKELIKQLDGATGDKNYAKRRNFFDKIKKMFNE